MRGVNPSRLVFTSAQANKIQGFVLSFPLFRLSRSENLPRVQCDPRAEGDAGEASLYRGASAAQGM